MDKIRKKLGHTPPSPSLTTITYPRRSACNSAHLLYNVARLTPSRSKLYSSVHSSSSCSRGGMSKRISSASVRDSSCDDDDGTVAVAATPSPSPPPLAAVLPSLSPPGFSKPLSLSGCSGGGRKGDARRRGAAGGINNDVSPPLPLPPPFPPSYPPYAAVEEEEEVKNDEALRRPKALWLPPPSEP